MSASTQGPVLLLLGADTWRIGYSVQLGLAESIAGPMAVHHTLVQRLDGALLGAIARRGRRPVVILEPFVYDMPRASRWLYQAADHIYDLADEQDWRDLEGDARSRCWLDEGWAA